MAAVGELFGGVAGGKAGTVEYGALNAVSYTHLDVYKRQVLGLATGSTPIGAYKQLAAWYEKGDVDFAEVSTYNLDEYRGLSHDDPQSYHYFCLLYTSRFPVDCPDPLTPKPARLPSQNWVEESQNAIAGGQYDCRR